MLFSFWNYFICSTQNQYTANSWADKHKTIFFLSTRKIGKIFLQLRTFLVQTFLLLRSWVDDNFVFVAINTINIFFIFFKFYFLLNSFQLVINGRIYFAKCKIFSAIMKIFCQPSWQVAAVCDGLLMRAVFLSIMAKPHKIAQH